jgi:Ni,Fe-hydrogenase III large subunit/Ni,Fe-hydrogenase III component G
VPLRSEKTDVDNEVLFTCANRDLREAAASIVRQGGSLVTVIGLDLRPLGQEYAIEYVFTLPGQPGFLRLRCPVPEGHREYPSVTTELPAAQWHEREMQDLLGLVPRDHPDPRRLVHHERYPAGYHPLRKDVSATKAPEMADRHYDYFEVHGSGLYELPVGPIHAGIIEPGHFRFSNIGELILHLDARLFYTHRGIEKIVEGKRPEEALFTVERTCGVCTVSHAVSFSTAVERLAGVVLPARALWLRTLLLEMERLYNHVGDIGNICAGAGFHIGSSQGAILKERLQSLNEKLSGHRFLMGIVGVGGLRYDIGEDALAAARTSLATLRGEVEAYFEMLFDSGSFVTRIEGPGAIDRETVLALGGTGVAARASGVSTDYRRDHPHLAYGDLDVPVSTAESGDVAARLRVRAHEAIESFRLVDQVIGAVPGGPAAAAVGPLPPRSSSMGFSESPRGSNVHWLMTDDAGSIYRLRIRSASFANWPLVTRAVVQNMVPEFPLINKSFELCYACCDR